MAEDQQLRQQEHDKRGNTIPISSSLVPGDHLFPETARWCLAAIRNLTRPCNDPTAAHILIKSGTYSLILQYITVGSSCQTDSDTNSEFENDDNRPYIWNSNSIQDAALSIVMNLAASTASREYINETLTIKILSAITEYPQILVKERHEISKEQTEQMNFQCLKAVSQQHLLNMLD
jgi:hypothetical protein